jgi:hypothetical protein
MTPAELAPLLKTTPQGLANHRYRGTGPAFVKAGRKVLYRRQDVDAWLEQNVHTRTDTKRSTAA